MSTIFTPEQERKAQFILDSPYSQLSGLLSNDIKELCCAWSYYSGKIEGNTYTYVETEALLKDDITSEKRYEDAKMLKNLYTAFSSELRYILREKQHESIDEKLLLRLHQIVSSELLSGEDVGKFRDRPVAITRTEYIPPKTNQEILQLLGKVLYQQEQIENPLEKAVFLHCNIAKIQPFIDGNKRVSRLVESIALMNANIIPVYSTKDSDFLSYRRGLVEFYETGSYQSYADYFLNRQIDRINEIAPAKHQYTQEQIPTSRLSR